MSTLAGLVDASKQAPPAEITTEVCIIGSGCGGATAAQLLAEAGHEVVVLEEGADFTGKRLTQREGAMYDQLYMDRGGRVTEDLAVSVLQGRALGGGAVINACDVVPMSDAVLSHWQRAHGLTDLTPEALKPHLEAALADLAAAPVPESMVNKANALLREGTRRLGLRGELMHHNRVGCEELGTCLIGCPADAKRSPRFVAIPRAAEAGARFYTRVRAVRIEDAGAEMKRVVAKTLDEKGYHEKADLTVRARVVIVAANAVASAQLLLRSGVGNEHVGKNLMLQPQLPVQALFEERVDGFVGIPQSFAVTEYEQHDHERYGLWGFRIEAIMGTPGIVSTLLPYTGDEGKRLMTQYAHSAASLLLVPDEPSGTVELTGSGRPLIRYDHRDNHKQRLREAVKVTARIYLAAGAQYVLVPVVPPLIIRNERELSSIDSIPFDAATAPLISAHQQGTVRFSPTAKTGAADPDGQVYGTRDVYVFDSSGFPTSASSHTMTPILTLSRYLTTRLNARLG